MKTTAASLDKLAGEGAFEVLAKAQALERQGHKVLHFEIGEPDFDTPENIKAAARHALDANFTHYVASGGILELKEAVRAHIAGTRGFEPDVEQILIIAGVKPGIFCSILGLVEQGDEVIYQDPGFPTYGSLIDYVGARRVPVRLLEENEFRMTPDDVAAKITKNTKLIIINSPQNPTGSMLTSQDVREIAALAAENDIYLLSDEIYSMMTYGERFHSVCSFDACAERSILLDGFSKTYAMTGWRLGYLLANRELIKKMTTFVINSASCTNAFVQRAGVEALEGEQSKVNAMLREFELRRKVIVEGLNEIDGFKCIMPRGAFYAFPNIKGTGMGCRELAERLLNEAKVAVLPGTAFGEGGTGYLRFSYANSVENIKEAIERLKSHIKFPDV